MLLLKPHHVKTCFLHNAKQKRRSAYHATNQCLQFCYIDSTLNPSVSYLRNFKRLASFGGPTAQFVSDLHVVGNSKDRFSYDAANCMLQGYRCGEKQD